MSNSSSDFDIDSIMNDELGIGFKLPSNLAFERLRMANRALIHLTQGGGTLSKSAYELIKGLYYSRNELGLEYPPPSAENPESFSIDFVTRAREPESEAADDGMYAFEQPSRSKSRGQPNIPVRPKKPAAPIAATATEVDELFAAKDRNILEDLKTKIRTTQQTIAQRVVGVEEHLGSFEFKVGKFCEAIAALDQVAEMADDNEFDRAKMLVRQDESVTVDAPNSSQRKAVVAGINHLLNKELVKPVNHIGIESFKYPLASAIAAHYPNVEDKLDAFLRDLRKIMKAQYPLSGFNPGAIKPKAKSDEKCAPNDTENNIDLLSKALKFDDTQKKLLWFFSCNDKNDIVGLIRAVHPTMATADDYANALSILLDLRMDDIKSALKPDGTLVSFGFLAYDDQTHAYSVDKSLRTLLRRNYHSEKELLIGLLGPSPSSQLNISDYDYMKNDLGRMTHVLDSASKGGSSAHKTMTLYGPRGTGKTELTAILAKQLGMPAFLVGVTQKDDESGALPEEPTRDERIRDFIRKAFIIKQTGMKAFLVVDEADGLLDQSATHKKGSKAFINYLLEQIEVPTVVIFNEPERLEPATKRRVLPAFQMAYMPFQHRVNAIIAKVEAKTTASSQEGIRLQDDQVTDLAGFAERLSIAEIDRCIGTAAETYNRLAPAKKTPVSLRQLIYQEFHRALTFFNNGVPPLPMERAPALFHPELASTSLEDFSRTCMLMTATYENNPAAFKGKAFAIVGHGGTGKLSVAKHIVASVTKKPPMIVQMDAEQIKTPAESHAMDLARSAREQLPIIFTGADEFLRTLNSTNPLFARVQAHSQPVIFVGSIEQDLPPQSLSHLSKLQVIRTGSLSPEQVQIACKKILNVDVEPHELSGDALTIGDIVRIKDELAMLGLGSNKEETASRLNQVGARLKNPDQGTPSFAVRLNRTASQTELV